MNNILNEIQTITGIHGIIISNKAGKPVAITGDITTFNISEFSFDKLPELVEIIYDLNLKQQGAQFSFSNLYIDIRTFPEGFIGVVCDPEIDFTLVDLSMNRILNNIK